ncbi:hypothetical protein HWV07_08680 [Natronomonas salina]|uniref:hypothetical protein n=1 Tax=Natronomonas salina TaxID=1710540 RepID=UPI0015B4E144|nr:hypothetical protein [Natronomonas salina]QLD89100.1 hypothetical protein HWV07_08680 [Natronomonas salina]
MGEPVLYAFDPHNEADTSIVRREIFWLIKDRLIDTKQTGWSLSHGQIEPYPPESDDGVLAHISTEKTDSIRNLLTDFFSNGCGFLVPLSERIDDNQMSRRLAGIDAIGLIEDPTNPSIEPLDGVGAFWSESPLQFPMFTSDNRHSKSVFNIAHPYATGTGLMADVDKEYMVNPDGLRQSDTAEGPLYSVVLRPDPLDIDTITSRLQECIERIPTGTSLTVSRHCEAEAKFAMNELDLTTGALSAGSVLLELSDQIDTDPETVNRVIEVFDTLGISLAGEYKTSTGHFFLFKFHPRHSEVESAGPAFDGARERRKLAQTEWARQSLPGYKHLDSGKRKLDIATFGDWTISVERPGRKDADDFTYHIDGPDLTTKEETKPLLSRVFIDVGRHLNCPDSGKEFLGALYRLWDAQVPMSEAPDIIEKLDAEMPQCSEAVELWYDRRVLLYILVIQFTVEDLNYRFNFHPTYGGPSYRKQGRDQPMNGLLRVGAQPFDEEAFDNLAESTKEGGLIHRPTEFNGPTHLREWYRTHGLLESD